MTATATLTEHQDTSYCTAACSHWFVIISASRSKKSGLQVKAARMLYDVTRCLCAERLIRTLTKRRRSPT